MFVQDVSLTRTQEGSICFATSFVLKKIIANQNYCANLQNTLNELCKDDVKMIVYNCTQFLLCILHNCTQFHLCILYYWPEDDHLRSKHVAKTRNNTY
jgi:hypothetical protein